MSGIKPQRIAEYRSTTSEAKPALPVELLSSRHPRIEIGRVPEPSRLSAILMPPVIKTISPIQLQKSSPGCSYPIGRAAQTREMAGNHVVEAWLVSCSGTSSLNLACQSTYNWSLSNCKRQPGLACNRSHSLSCAVSDKIELQVPEPVYAWDGEADRKQSRSCLSGN